jgi:hypothetical protein
MLLEIKLKYYNSTLQMGFNNWRQVYDCTNQKWVKASEHNGRVVYGNKRIPYSKIKKGIDIKDYVVQEYCPF